MHATYNSKFASAARKQLYMRRRRGPGKPRDRTAPALDHTNRRYRDADARIHPAFPKLRPRRRTVQSYFLAGRFGAVRTAYAAPRIKISPRRREAPLQPFPHCACNRARALRTAAGANRGVRYRSARNAFLPVRSAARSCPGSCCFIRRGPGRIP